MKHAHWLTGLIPVLAVAACGSASGTAVTASHRPAVAEPGQPVPASAVHRLAAIADRAVTLNGGHPVAWATAVVTTHAKALTSATPSDTTPGAKAIVYLVTIKGRFVCHLCSGPPGGHAPTGTYLLLVIDARTFAGTDAGIGPKPPPVRPMGPWSLAVHEYLRHLAAAGFAGSPRVLGTESNREVLTFIDGDVAMDPTGSPAMGTGFRRMPGSSWPCAARRN